MDCVFKKALENEIEHYKKDGDIKSFLQYLHYFDIDKALNGDECGDIINSNLSIDESFDLLDVEHNFGWAFNKIIQRRNEYLSSAKTENDFKKYSLFIHSINWEEFNYDEMSAIHQEMIKGLDNYTYGEITI